MKIAAFTAIAALAIATPATASADPYCTQKTQSDAAAGAALGALGGAVLGNVISDRGHKSEGAIVGAIGGAIGGALLSQGSKKSHDCAQVYGYRDAPREVADRDWRDGDRDYGYDRGADYAYAPPPPPPEPAFGRDYGRDYGRDFGRDDGYRGATQVAVYERPGYHAVERREQRSCSTRTETRIERDGDRISRSVTICR